MTDWKQVLGQLRYDNVELPEDVIRLCTAASRLPEGVDAVKVLEEYVTREWEQYTAALKHACYGPQLEPCSACFPTHECEHDNTELKRIDDNYFDVCCECGETVDR